MRPLHRLIPLVACVVFAVVYPLAPADQSDYIVRLQD